MSEAKKEDVGFLDAFSGQGKDQLLSGGGVPYLSLVQKTIIDDNDKVVAKMGQWKVSGTDGGIFADTIEVVVVGWANVFTEHEAGGKTVATYAVDGVNYQESGKGSTYKCWNPETGNKLVRTYLLVVTLPEAPDVGYVIFPVNASSKSACTLWRKMLLADLLPSGKSSPIFGTIWTLSSKVVKANGHEWAQLDTVKKYGNITKDFFDKVVFSALPAGKEPLLLVSSGSQKTEVVAEDVIVERLS